MFWKLFRSGIPIYIVIAFCVPVILPYLTPGFFPTHDGEWAVVRLADMFRTLKDFQFPVRFSGALNFGYGYPLFNFAYPFPYYLGILLYIPFHSFVTSIKLLFVLSVILSGIFMYFASLQLWKSRLAALVSAVVYVYLPYRMVDLYVRGSIGESLSFVLFPVIYMLMTRLFDNPKNRIIIAVLAVMLAMLVTTHNIMAIVFIPMISLFMLIRIVFEKRADALQSFILCLGLGAGLSFFFWFPALFEKSNILLSVIPISDRTLSFVKFSDLIYSPWRYGVPGSSEVFTYQLGFATIFIIPATILVFVKSMQKRFVLTPLKKYALWWLIIFLLTFLMLFSFTNPIWKATPLLKEINYPFVLLSQLGFIASILVGFIIVQGKIIRNATLIICFISSLFVLQYAKPQGYVDRGDSYYLTNEATTTSSHELMPLWVKDPPRDHFPQKVEVVMGNSMISNVFYNSNSVTFNYQTQDPATIRINTIYYPGWSAFVNQKEVAINFDNSRGVMDIQVPAGKNSVHLKFDETLPRLTADLTSILFFAIILLIVIYPWLKFKK